MAVASCATGRRVTLGDLLPGALRRPRTEVLALLDVADPDGPSWHLPMLSH